MERLHRKGKQRQCCSLEEKLCSGDRTFLSHSDCHLALESITSLPVSPIFPLEEMEVTLGLPPWSVLRISGDNDSFE